MKIAHVSATFPPNYNGTANVCYHNALEVAKLGHDVQVFTSDFPMNGYRDPSEIEVHRLPVIMRVGNAPITLPLLSALKGFDVLHLHYPFYWGAETVLLRWMLDRTPYVITYHQDVRLRGPLEPAVKLHRHTLGSLVLKKSKLLFMTSRDYAMNSSIRDLVMQKGERAVEVPNGVDIERFNPKVSSNGLMERHRIGQGTPVVLFVGALDRAHYFKGIDVLLRTIASLEAEARLVVVGDGDMREAYSRQVSELGVRDRVTFAGLVSHEELPSYYAMCDVLVLPSTTEGEAFGLVLIEAMACGKPVIASRLPGVRSVVEDGATGLLVEPGSAQDLTAKLNMLLSNPQAMAEMGLRGRRRAEERYSWNNIGGLLERLYREALESKESVA